MSSDSLTLMAAAIIVIAIILFVIFISICIAALYYGAIVFAILTVAKHFGIISLCGVL